jgi:signal transduction histidine kinase
MITGPGTQLSLLAEQQVALRRVATLVARGVATSELVATVAEEMARCLHVKLAGVLQYEADGTPIRLAYNEPWSRYLRVGEPVTVEAQCVAAAVLHTGRAAGSMPSRMPWKPRRPGPIRDLGIRSMVAAPIIVDARLWGLAVVGSSWPEPLPTDTEARVGEFAELVATAIAAATTRAELIASHARIITAADDARRRLERDLHNGAQQRLISLALQLRTAQASVTPHQETLKEQLAQIISGLTAVSEELREISHGIHPAILSDGGLVPACKMLARRSTVPVTLDLAVDRRLPEPVEVAAYYVLAEALTNTAKHARATHVTVRANYRRRPSCIHSRQWNWRSRPRPRVRTHRPHRPRRGPRRPHADRQPDRKRNRTTPHHSTLQLSGDFPEVASVSAGDLFGGSTRAPHRSGQLAGYGSRPAHAKLWRHTSPAGASETRT